MIFFDRDTAREEMNRLGQQKKPFLFIIDYKQEHSLVAEPSLLSPDEILYDLNGFTNVSLREPLLKTNPVIWKPKPGKEETYFRSFDQVMEHLKAGNSYLVNLTAPTEIETNLSLKEIFYRASALYKLWIKDTFTVFSPEIFVRMQDEYVYSYPMKGTIRAEFVEGARALLNDPKESAEHATITDLIRNDLSQIAEDVTVTRYRYLEEVITLQGKLWQTSSEIRGKLTQDWRSHLGDLFFRLLPAGSITGAPKKKTLEIIAEAEWGERGFYTGVAGYFDGRKLDSGVMIRFISQEEGKLIYRSGGGITALSDARAEYNELIEKVYVPFH